MPPLNRPFALPPMLHVVALVMADFVSTVAFAALFSATRDVALSVGVSIAAGLAGLVWTRARGRPVDAMQWTSLGLVVVFGAAGLITGDPRVVMLKPALIYFAIGLSMLRTGWMRRYLPPVAHTHGAGVADVFGRIWSGAMFACAALALGLALSGDVKLWALFVATGSPALKLGLGTAQYLVTRRRVVRAIRAEREAAPRAEPCPA